MTRLTSELVESIRAGLSEYDNELLKKTGRTLRQVACRAAGVREAEMRDSIGATLVGVVPVTSGEGTIEGFCSAVESIVTYLEAPSFITRLTDVAGLAEAIERGADLVFLADDDRFIVIDFLSQKVVDNSEATARGYVAALEFLAGKLENRAVLVIGAGRVGRKALVALKESGARAAVYDPDHKKIEALENKDAVVLEQDLDRALEKYSLLFDASPAPGIIQERHIKPDTAIAACGIPLGLSPGFLALVRDRLIHDPLQIGVATMLIMAIAGRKKDAGGRSERSHRF